MDQVEGEDPNGIIEFVERVIVDRGWRFLRIPVAGSASGYTSSMERVVVVDSTLSEAHAARTALHELAHFLMHTAKGEYPGSHRGLIEVEAESVAYVTAGLLGLDTTDYSSMYLSSWTENRGPELIREVADNVVRYVHQIMDMVDESAASLST